MVSPPAAESNPDAVLGATGVSTVDGVDFARRVEAGRVVWSLTATDDLSGIGRGPFAEPTNYVSFSPATFLDPAATLQGFSFTQFAHPVLGAADRPFTFDPAPNLQSPAAVVPLLIDSTHHGVTLLAPLGAWHEQAGVVGIGDGIGRTDTGLVARLCRPDGVLIKLDHRGWALHVCCPITNGGGDGQRRALIGDPRVYVTMGRTRVGSNGSAILADGEAPVALRHWLRAPGSSTTPDCLGRTVPSRSSYCRSRRQYRRL